VSLYRGTLTVRGTEGDDVLVVSRSGNWLTVAGRSFDASSVRLLVISGGGGNDLIRDESDMSAIIFGGAGNDTIYGGRGHDTIYGGQGHDTIYGERGHDVIYGGSGTNTIDGGPGNNLLYDASVRLIVTNSSLEFQIVQLVNQYRQSQGLAPLRVNGQLNAAAALHSGNMAATSNHSSPWQALQHVLPGSAQPGPQDRLDAVGYDDWTSYFAWGENIAFGYTSAVDVVRAWLDSPTHRRNIFNPHFTETGVSVRADHSGTLFFTQTFATKR